jgi:hypothetical protein
MRLAITGHDGHRAAIRFDAVAHRTGPARFLGSTIEATAKNELDNKCHGPHIQGVPTVARMGGFRIVLRNEDHAPPHVHVIEGDDEAMIQITPTVLLAGRVSPRVQREAVDWIEQNREALLVRWRECGGAAER